MRKVKLDFDGLRVESFTAGLQERLEGGTVEARATGNTCQSTCWKKCPDTCSQESDLLNKT